MLSIKGFSKLFHNHKLVFISTILAGFTFISWGSLNRSSNRFKAGYMAYQLAVTKHALYLAGQTIRYRATAGYMPLKQKNNRSAANIFYVAYQADNMDTVSNIRPITFVFNGGPGSASVWLHMGSFGPVRVLFKNDKGNVSEQPHSYSDNPYTWLGFTDLVFIDPISTGYSRTEDGTDRQFHSYDADISSIGQFIQQYLTQYHRQQSPKFLVGESYGAIRAVGLTAYLHDEYKIAINGITLISPALNYQLINFHHGNETPYPYYLPSYAVAAQYHHLLKPAYQQLSVEQLRAKVAAFAQGSYAQYLGKGDQAAVDLTDKIIDSLHEYTGLPKSKLRELNGRITDKAFCRLLQQTDKQITGMFDSRFAANAKQSENTDPSESNLRGAFTSAFSRYIATDLKYVNKLPYQATIAASDWNYGPDATNSYLDLSETLRKIMIQNPDLKINVAAGLYDLATPAGTTEYVIRHLGLPPSLRANISISYYASGHMIYISGTADHKFQNDGKIFYQQTLKGYDQVL
jgi:carboxypeptidase C (cathepsin A)